MSRWLQVATPSDDVRIVMTLPAHHRELVRRAWDLLHEGPRDVAAALLCKGPVSDLADGLSDLDFRVVLDTRAADSWQWADDVFYRVYKGFADEFRDGWRIIEHMPGKCFALDELSRAVAVTERFEWDVLREDSPGMIPPAPALDDTVRRMYLAKFLAYRDPYDARRDPPINVAPAYRDQHLLFSICWHYYAPALQCAALAAGDIAAASKWHAVRSRADAGNATACRVLEAAEAQFRGPVDDLASRCTQDIQDRAREIGAGADPWRAIDEQVGRSPLGPADRLCTAIVNGRMFPGRWRFYAEAPEGFELAAVLRIDRGHIGGHLLGPLLNDADLAVLRSYSPDTEAHEASMSFLMAQRQATDASDPRDVFARLREHYLVVREALDKWYLEEDGKAVGD